MSIRRLALAAFAASGLIFASVPAHASSTPATTALDRATAVGESLIKDDRVRSSATFTGQDATGDATGGADIVSSRVTFDAKTITVRVVLAQDVPAASDERWRSGRFVLATLLSFNRSDAINAVMAYVHDGNGLVGIGQNQYGIICAVNGSVSGNVITLTAAAECFNRPGAIAHNTIFGDLSAVANGASTTEFDAVPDAGFSPVAAEPGGYYLLGADGGIFTFGDAAFHGSTGNLRLNAPVVGMSAMPSGSGYRFVASDGGIFTYGNAGFFGSTGNLKLNKPVVGMATTKSGNGYWLVASDGGVFAFGDAKFLGSTGDLRLNKPVIGIVPTRTGDGYWLIASDGGVFTFGDAKFVGSLGNVALNKPITSLAPTTSGDGYYLLGEDGGVFTFGDAEFRGAAVGTINGVAAGIAADASGYRIVDSTGGVWNYGAVYHYGDLIDLNVWPNSPIVGVAAVPGANA